MGESVLVFISHSSEDKEAFIEPLVQDLEECYITPWLDKKMIMPGDNLRKSILREGLDKADVVVIFFTENSLKSAWVDREIKHVLREETKKGNDFDLSKVISVFDSENTYKEISNKYPELTDDLLHLMSSTYDKIDLGKLISAIWSKYLSLQCGDTETQKQLLAKDKEIFQKDKEIQKLQISLSKEKDKNDKSHVFEEYETIFQSGEIDDIIDQHKTFLTTAYIEPESFNSLAEANAFGLIQERPKSPEYFEVTPKGRDFFSWFLLNHKSKE